MFPFFEWIKSPWHPNSSNPVRAGQFQALPPFFLGWKCFWLKCFKITKHSFNFGWFKCFQIIKHHFGWLTQLLNTSGYTCCWLTPRSNMFFRRCPIAMLRWHQRVSNQSTLNKNPSESHSIAMFDAKTTTFHHEIRYNPIKNIHKVLWTFHLSMVQPEIPSKKQGWIP